MGSQRPQAFRIVVDSREQAPWTFDSAPVYEGTSVTVSSLPTGDYSVEGFQDAVAVERKSLPDLVACLGRERDRFARELARARGLESFAVVIEGSFTDLKQGQYRSMLNPHSACQSICAFMARWHIPFVFAGTRAAAEYATWSLLRQYVEGKRHELRAVEKALGSPAGACARGTDNHKADEPRDLLEAFGGPAEAHPGMVPEGGATC